MPDKLSVDIEGLHGSAARVQGHGDDLAAGHSSASTRISAVSGGWTGQSARSLSAWTATLNQRSAALVTSLDDHGQQMHTTARTFATTEEQRTETLSDVYRGSQG